MHFVIAYDVVADRRRRKILELLKNHGIRVQYSVVECDLTRAQAETLRGQLRELLDEREDRLHIYAMCNNCYFRSEAFGPDEPVCE